QQSAQGADGHQNIAHSGQVIFGTANPHQDSAYENESKEPFQGHYGRLISTSDACAFVSDLFDVAEALERRGLRLLPRNVLPAMFFRQQIKMKLQLFFYFK